MSEENKKEGSVRKILNRIFNPSQKTEPKIVSEFPTTPGGTFRWFSLITIPETERKAVETFNDEVAAYVGQSLEGRQNISFLEMYLTRAAMSRLSREIFTENNFQSLVSQVNARLPGADDDNKGDSLRVGFNQMGLSITPALQRIFDKSFIARQITPPQVYAPLDESEIALSVDQFLIGSLKIEDATRKQLGETPIRALVSSSDRGHFLTLHTHVDFDLLLKAFPDAEFCAYPLGISIDCRLEIDGNRRRVRQIDLDLYDTKLLAKESQSNVKSKLYYYLVEGGNEQRNVINLDPIYPVMLKGENTLNANEVDDTYEIVPGSKLRVPVAGKVGMQVILKYEDAQGNLRTDSYKFLFRFFRNALRFSTTTNKLAANGQFIPATGETYVMLPPLQKDGVSEAQIPAFIVQPLADDPSKIEIRRHADSSLDLTVDGEALGAEPIRIDFADRIEIHGESGTEGDSQEIERFNFILRPLAALNEQRKNVNIMRGGNYIAFIEVESDRSISLRSTEVVLGRNQFLNRRTSVGTSAVTITRRYVTWVVTPKKDEKILYYCKVQGDITQPLTQLTKPMALGLVGTYYFYIGDFEFIILLESTPRNEILFEVA